MAHPLEHAFPFVRKIIESGYNAYIVGGAVREFLMGKIPTEYDIATNIPSTKLRKLFPNAKPVYPEKYGVFELKLQNGVKLEFARMREDINYTGRHSDIVFTDSIEKDLKRREITINAIAYDIKTNSLIDPFNGKEDIEKKIIRTVGEPIVRFSEDKLRMLRAIRFAARFGFKLERKTENGIKRLAPAISELSTDAIRNELEKMLKDKSAARAIYILAKTDIIKAVFEIEIDKETLKKLLLSIRFLSKRTENVDTKWAVFFYFSHPNEKKIKEFMRERCKLKLINYIMKNIDFLETILNSEPEPEKVLDVIDNKNLPSLVLAANAVYFCKNRKQARYESRLIAKFPSIFSARLITGDDVKSILNASGRHIRKLLKAIRMNQLKGEISTKEEAIAKLIELNRLYEEGSN